MIFDKILDDKVEENKNLSLADYDWIENPPTFLEHLENAYDEPIKLSKKQYNAVIAVIGEDPKNIFSPERLVSLGVLCVGKGGGKDFLIAPLMDYIIEVLLHNRNPQKFLGIDDYLDLLNVAVKGKQGEQVFFSKFTYRVKHNKWYKKRYKIYEKGKLVNNPEKAEGTIYINADNALFPSRIRCLSESSKNETWEGYNVIFFILDEISGFVSETQRENGWNIYKTANSSCISRRTSTFKGIGFVISYPRKEKDDIIIDLYKLSRQQAHIHGVFAFSWQFKPSFCYSGEKFIFENRRFNRFFSPKKDCLHCGEKKSMVYGKGGTAEKEDGYICSNCGHFERDEEPVMGIRIPMEYKEDFDTDPEGSLTKYCCLPPRVSGEYFEYPEKVWACIDAQQEPMFKTEYYNVIKEVEGEQYTYRAIRIVAFTEKDPDVRMKNHYVAWLDNAEVACDAVLGIARKEMMDVRREDGSWQQKEICRIVDVVNWLPLPNQPIDLENVEDFLTKELPRYINLREVGADRWESALLSQKLMSKGIRSHRFNLSNTHYDTAKYFIYLGAVRIFDEEPYQEKSLKELTSLEQLLALEAGDTKPNKKSGVKKDKADAVVGCINLLMGGELTQNKKKTPTAQKVGNKSPVARVFSTRMPAPVSVKNYNPYLTQTTQSLEPERKLPVPRVVR